MYLKYIFIPIIAILLSFVAYKSINSKSQNKEKNIDVIEKVKWWKVQSIDTMKMSRDKARTILHDPTYDSDIDTQMLLISQTGASHVAIATPYDDEFVPVLRRWVSKARKYNLNIWFRGNFSGWEGWFDYSKISREEHSALLEIFLNKNKDLFKDNDIFSSCPECENGGPGDPRSTGDIVGFRNFLINEHNVADRFFVSNNLKINTSYMSMNGDVAKIIYDDNLLSKLDNTLTVDHYEKTVDGYINFLRDIHAKTKANIIIGEFGAPIPDIHGDFSYDDQARWINDLLTKLTSETYVVGLNYWVNIGGTTQLWRSNYTPLESADTITSFYRPKIIYGQIQNDFGSPLSNVIVYSKRRSTTSNVYGHYSIPVIINEDRLDFVENGYEPYSINTFTEDNYAINVTMSQNTNGLNKIIKNIYNFIKQ